MEAGKYWSIDSFLGDEEQTSVKLRNNAKGAAYLDPLADPNSKDLEEGREIKLPLWLALTLAKKGYIDVQTPAYFGKAYKDTMKADPTTLNLKERSQYIYETGKNLTDYTVDKDLPSTLMEVFRERFKKIVDYACSEKVSETSTFVMKLTTLEKEIFNARQEYLHHYDMWKNRKGTKIQVHKELVQATKRWKN